MAHELGHTGWIQLSNETEANDLITKINTCMGLPTPDGKTKTWSIPFCLQDGYSPTATTESYFVIVKDQIKDCLTQQEWDSQITELPIGWVDCGTPEPIPSGSTENNI